MRTLIVVTFMILIAHCAHAENISATYSQFLADEIDRMEQSLILEEAQSTHNWALNLIRTQVTGEIGLEVPFLAKFSINPSIELFFKRK